MCCHLIISKAIFKQAEKKALCVEVEGGVCVREGKYGGVLWEASKATLGRTGGKRSASDSTPRSAAVTAAAAAAAAGEGGAGGVGISRSQVSSPASVTACHLAAAATALTTVKAGFGKLSSHSETD